MEENKIQTLHPEKGKKNKRISIEKYEIVKAAILKVLQKHEPTHTELVKLITKDLDSKIENISWYAITVKLDLEARRIIEKTESKPQKYKITKGRG